MPDPIAHLATPLPDGSIASRYTELPDGSWAPVTDTDDAPCCCDVVDACWLVVLPCNCDCPSSVSVVRLDTAIDAVWPAESREAGSVIEAPDGCYVLMGSTTQRPATAGEILADDIIAVHPSCDASPCTNPPCSGMGGFAHELGSCVGFGRISCLARIRVGYTMSGRYVNTEEFSDGIAILEKNIIAAGEYVIETGQPLRWNFTLRAKGINDQRAGGGGSTPEEWDVTQTVDQDTPGPNAGGVEPVFANSLGITAPVQPYTGMPGAINSFSIADDLIDADSCNASAAGVNFVVSHQNQSSTTPTRVRSSTSAIIEYPGENRIAASFSTQIAVREIELVDGTVLEFEDCDQPIPSIAIACDAEAETQEITYDAQLLTGLSRTIIDIETGQVFIPTSTPSTDAPIAFVESPDGCPEPPDPTGDIYQVNVCRGGRRAVSLEVDQNGALVARSIGYRPGDGVSPGEGFVLYTDRIGQNECLYLVAGQPTTIVLDEEPDIVLTSYAGQTCRNLPSRLNDSRPECQDTDAGGGVTPSGNNQITAPQDPALQAELARQAQMRTGQFPGRCPSCGG